MPKPSVVIFDLGKVLLDFDYTKAAQKLAAQGGVAVEAVRQHIDQSPLLHEYETGLISTAEFFEQVRAATGFTGSADDFAEIFSDIYTRIEGMIELHAILRKNGTPVFALSNTSEMAVTHIRKRYPFFAEFDGFIFSFEVGAMKPAARIYEAAERLCGRRGAEILFIDDRAENCSAAANRGWQTITHISPETTRAALRRLSLIE